jgi:glucose-1-phosphate thymidylyltransferase
MKGIILAGGSGSRLYPITLVASKQLLPVYDKPMIYYPLSVLMLAGIKDVLIISTPEDTPRFKELLKDGSEIGMNFQYLVQPKPEGIAQAFILGEDFIGDDDVCLILGDNIFYGYGLSKLLQHSVQAVEKEKNSIIFGYYVNDPQRYGVAEFDQSGHVISIEEKPDKPKSSYAIVGLYIYTNDVINIAKKIKPSKRGELEITSVNQEYLSRHKLKVELLGRGYAWLDTGTHTTLLDAGKFIQTIEERQGLKIACIEEIAYKMGYIDKNQLLELAEPLKQNNYGKYLIKLAQQVF